MHAFRCCDLSFAPGQITVLLRTGVRVSVEWLVIYLKEFPVDPLAGITIEINLAKG
jgi:hypothetical protein